MTREALDAAALLTAARHASRNAYAPYSGFSVGAALLDDGGRIHLGVNVENASFGLTTCAEQGAIAGAVAAGARSFSAIAIAASAASDPCFPCGRCRQLLHEFSPDLLVITDGGGEPRITRLSFLLPEPFGADLLGERDRHG